MSGVKRGDEFENKQDSMRYCLSLGRLWIKPLETTLTCTKYGCQRARFSYCSAVNH